jgi:hypothetical protein
MIKRFLIILVMLFWCSAGVAMDVKEYLHTRQNGSNADQKSLDIYILGVGTGFFWSYVISSTAEEDTMFCPPKNFGPTAYDYRSFIDAEIVYFKSKNLPYENFGIELFMANYLIRIYPCK